MTKTILFLVIFFSLTASKASEDTIIDPELMNKGVWAEPNFRSPNEAPRETASSENPEVLVNNEKMPEQYLDVLEKIPVSEPTISRAWLEHKVSSDD